MDKTHTTALLDLLEKPELTALGKFLNSPFFTAKKFLYSLFIELRDPEQRAAKPPKGIFKKVFPKDKFDPESNKLNKALSDLNLCIQKFLIVQEALSNPPLQMQAETEALFKRRDAGLFQRKIAAMLKKLPGNEAISETVEGWHLRFWALKRSASYPLADRLKLPGDFFDGLNDSLDLYYFISKLQLACNHAAYAQLLRLENKQTPFQQLLDQTERLEISGKSPLLALYRALLHLCTEPDASFEGFFMLLKKLGPRLEREELGSLVVLALNFCIRRYREGELRAFDWYREVYDWPNTKKALTAVAMEEIFLNTGVMFAKSQDVAGFDTFLEQSKNSLPVARRRDAIALLLAYRHFYMSQFSEATRLLNREVDTRHPRYTLLYHSLKVRNTYEEWLLKQAELQDLKRALDNFEDFLQRKDLFAESLRQSYRALIWFIQKMLQNWNKHTPAKKELRKELEKRQPAAQDWLSVKIGGLPM